MKLLTLEEIEEIQNDTDKIGETYINVSEMMVGIKTMQSLLATARAYLELKSKIVDPSNIEKFLGVERLKEEDKPHAPTIRAIVEAFKAGMTQDVEFYFVAQEAIKSLEKHL